jgi:hypothetical protein
VSCAKSQLQAGIVPSLVRSLFCGLPRPDRRMAVFVSGSDESAGKTQRDIFVFAGWVGPEDDWSRFFAPAWKERVLDGPPPIPYLHMTDIRSPQWRSKYGLSQLQADDRIDEAVLLLDTMQTLFPAGVSIDAGAFRDNFGKTKIRSRTGGYKTFDPDYFCFLAYVWFVLNHVAIHRPEAEKVDFIVERKGHVTKYIQQFHSEIAMALDAFGQPELSGLVGELIPGGKERVPLQAADVLCWHTARFRYPETMGEKDRRRYSTIAQRKGARWRVKEQQIAQLAAALLT